jgi:hypothetical protein
VNLVEAGGEYRTTQVCPISVEAERPEEVREMKTHFLISVAGLALLSCACATTFLVGKEGDERRGRFLGSNATYEMLCVSGDLLKVLETTHFSKEMKETFYRYHCSAERSFDKVKQIYTSMTPEQRKDIRTAFKKNGYSINSGLC